MRIVDEIAHATGWIAEERMARTSHALEVDGRVWLFDVVDWPELDDRVRELGEPAGVVQLLDRHNRDCAAVAQRLGVPHHVVPRELPGTPFELRPVVRNRWWREVALWWPERAAPARRGRARHDPVLPRRARSRPASTPCCGSGRRARSAASSPTICSWATARGSTTIPPRSRARSGRAGGGSRAGCSACRRAVREGY